MEELLAEIEYSIYPPRLAMGGQMAGPGPQGVMGVHPLGVTAICMLHRSQFKNRQAVRDMIEYTLAGYV